MIRVAACTCGVNIPSARFRVRQLIPVLRGLEIDVVEFAPRLGAYPPVNRWLRPFWALGTLAERVPAVLASHGYDVTLLQREMLSSHLTLEPLTKKPRILDVDDAIWLRRRGGSFAKRLAAICDSVICGNEFLAQEFSRWNRSIHIIPTAVDTDRFLPSASCASQGSPVIGWSGSSVGFKYLYSIERALNRVLKENPAARLRVVSDRKPEFRSIPAGRWEFVQWSAENEVRAVQSMTVGIMPLDGSPFALGKCAFKMLSYMSCALPVVVSPVGVNAEILKLADLGYGALSEDDWIQSLSLLLRDSDAASQKGAMGRTVCEQRYSAGLIGAQVARVIQQTI
jgi:glycosyltransferase involved in cell wall biosynthesis